HEGRAPFYSPIARKILVAHRECEAKAKQRDADAREAAFRESVDAQIGEIVKHVPPSLRVSFDSREFKARVKHPQLRAVAARYAPNCPVLTLLGPTGSGKSSTAAAIVDRLVREAADKSMAERSLDPFWFARRIRWAKTYSLVRARREHPLGEGEAPLVKGAIDASLLILDDLGNEPADPVIFEVLDARYDCSAPTLVTSGLRQPEIRSRYGEAAW